MLNTWMVVLYDRQSLLNFIVLSVITVVCPDTEKNISQKKNTTTEKDH